MVYHRVHCRSAIGGTLGAEGPPAQPLGGALGATSMRQDNVGPAIRCRRLAELFKHGRRLDIECKRADAQTLTSSMRIALDDLKLDRLFVAYPGERRYTLADRVEVVPLVELALAGEDPASLFQRRRR
jgi:hypothetical protein